MPRSGTTARMTVNGRRRRVVVIGASAGGVEALTHLVAALPPGYSIPTFVVLHVPPRQSFLPSILTRSGSIPAEHGRDRERIEGGRIVVAPPDFHLHLGRDEIHLHRGPRENGHRPAIDPLFRTAALHHGSAVLGVVLSGALDD